MASAISRRKIFAISRATIPFILVLIAVLMLIILVPKITFLVPELAGMR